MLGDSDKIIADRVLPFVDGVFLLLKYVACDLRFSERGTDGDLGKRRRAAKHIGQGANGCDTRDFWRGEEARLEDGVSLSRLFL